MIQVLCKNCNHLVVEIEQKSIGCLCDPDSPTWIAVSNGRLIHGSQARLEIIDG